jgi:hypothetical protein
MNRSKAYGMNILKPVTVGEMRAHVAALLAPMERLDDALIVRTVKRPDKARAAFQLNEIWIPAIKSKISYAVALHEIGHMLGRHRLSPHILTRERDAWRWAKAHALVWTPAMEIRCRSSLAWYQEQKSKKCGALSALMPQQSQQALAGFPAGVFAKNRRNK